VFHFYDTPAGGLLEEIIKKGILGWLPVFAPAFFFKEICNFSPQIDFKERCDILFRDRIVVYGMQSAIASRERSGPGITCYLNNVLQ
jgi:hypothetical protein